MSNRYFILPGNEALTRALDAWRWLDLSGKQPLLVTAFADVFFLAQDGVWILDTLEGELKHLCPDQAAFERVLATEEMEDTYLMSPIVDHLVKSGLHASDTQCYDYKVHPMLGGPINHENIELRSFVVALHLRGQLHEQVRHMKPGTQISGFTLDKPSPKKHWWRLC